MKKAKKTRKEKTRIPLGQHWLEDEVALQEVLAAGEVGPEDRVLEVGPGPGALTGLLIKQAKHVTAVEIDAKLVEKLKRRFKSAKNLDIVNQDILKFDLTTMPAGYKVVANIPYYLTANLLRVLLESSNPPVLTSLLVQKEVANRLAAQPGNLSVLAISAQFYSVVSLRGVVPAEVFSPPPEVDSQVVQLRRREQPLFDVDMKLFFQLVKAGFSQRRKKLQSSLAGGLHMTKKDVEKLLEASGVSPDARAQELPLEAWHRLYQAWSPAKDEK